MTDRDFETITELLRSTESAVQNARKLVATQTEEGLRMAEQYIEPIMTNLREVRRMLEHRQEDGK